MLHHDRNLLIALEGLDACGKGTQTELLVKALAGQAFKFPHYASASGQQILKAFNNPHPDPELAAYSLQALQTVNRLEERQRLYDMLNEGDVVLDRYTVSALAYGMADGLPYEWLDAIQLSDIPTPDYQILIDIPVDLSFVRRPDRADAYEANRDRMEKVRANYLELFAVEGGVTWDWKGKQTLWCLVDGDGTIAEVHQRILTCLQ